MAAIDVSPSTVDFSDLHERMQWYIDEGILAQVASLVLKGTDIIDYKLFGYMDLETKRPLQDDAIWRMYSSTKIVTSVAAMMLHEEGKFSLDDPVERFIPAFADMQVFKAGAETNADIEPAASPMTMRQILSHSSGLSYGFIDPNSLADKAYIEANVNAVNADGTLESLCDVLGTLPLAYQPGRSWRYSFGTDVTARVIEVISGQRFDAFLRDRIFEPLGMVDTDFYVPEEKMDRFTSIYAPLDLMNPMKAGLRLAEDPRSGAYSRPKSFLSGGGGLVSTISDYVTFLRAIINGGEWKGVRLLQPETLQLMRTNALDEGIGVAFPMWAMPNTVFGLGFALKTAPGEGEPDTAVGEYHWGGMAGTHSWMAPRAGIASFNLTQRMPGFWHPFSHDIKRMLYAKLG